MLAATLGSLLLGLARPAQAAKTPAPPLPIEISLPNLVKQPTTAPSHPVKVEVPGLAKVEVDLPDVGTLLGGKKAASVEPGPTQPGEPSRPRTTARPVTPRSSAGPISTAAAVPAPSGVTPRPTGTRASATRQVPRTVTAVAAEVPVRRSGEAAPAKRPAAAKARVVAEAFRGMLKGTLPVWLLVGIVLGCAAGTAMVVRSGRRQDAS